MKQYPSYESFDINDIVYGLNAPHVGIGVYTKDRKFSWPDRECTTKAEYDKWVKHIESEGYEVPEAYKNAFVQELIRDNK